MGLSAFDFETQGASAAAPLGISTRSVVGDLDSDVFTGGYADANLTGNPATDAIFKRLERYHLQSVARFILGSKHRLTTCLRLLRKNTETFAVAVWRSIQFDRCHYGGLVCCGSVWVCPVCAAKISERRKRELLHALEIWKTEYVGGVMMLTLTAPHRRNQRCSTLVDAFRKALRAFRNRSAWRTFVERYGVTGTITALEVTWGEENGWHVHTHTLLFVDDPSLDPAQIDTSTILGTWQKACVKSGLAEPNAHGLDLRDGTHVKTYITKYGEDGSEIKEHLYKWGVADELTKSHVKSGRLGSVTPWDMLRLFKTTGDCLFEQLFKQFAKAFHGKQQLVWSPGLKQMFGIKEFTDEELAAVKDDDATLLGYIHPEEWEVVLAADRRGELLEVARNKGWDGVQDYIIKLRARIADEKFQKQKGFVSHIEGFRDKPDRPRRSKKA